MTSSAFQYSPATPPLAHDYDTRTVQELLGHQDVTTTMIYTHVLNRGGRGVRSPRESLGGLLAAEPPVGLSGDTDYHISFANAADLGEDKSDEVEGCEMNIRVRPASVDDAELLRDLHDESIRGLCWTDYSPDEIDAWAAPKAVDAYADDIARHVFLVAELDGRVVGFGALSLSDAEILAIYVAPGHARRGVGSAILKKLEQAAREYGIGELGLKSSLTSELFYQAHGYAATGRCSHRTGDRELACTSMQKSL